MTLLPWDKNWKKNLDKKPFAVTLAPLPHSERVPGSNSSWGLSVWSLHVLPVRVCMGSLRVLQLPPTAQNMRARLIGDYRLTLNWVIMSVHCCVSLVALWWTGNLSRVYPASHPATLSWIKRGQKIDWWISHNLKHKIIVIQQNVFSCVNMTHFNNLTVYNITSIQTWMWMINRFVRTTITFFNSI